MFDRSIYKNRRNKLKRSFEKGLLLFPGNREQAWNYKSNTSRFRQDSSFLYFFGIDLPNIFALIDLDTDEEIVFADSFDTEDIIWTGEITGIAALTEQVGISKYESLSHLSTYIQTALQRGTDIHFLPVYRADVQQFLADLLKKSFAEIPHLVSDQLIETVIKLRSLKGAEEIAEIEKMVDLAYVMHTSAMKLAYPGLSERFIAGTVEGICLKEAYSVSFPVICSVRGEVLHNTTYHNILKSGQLLLTDAGAESLEHYASDITRVSPVGGKFSQQQKEIYQIVLAANKCVIELAKPGVKYKDIHLKAALSISRGLCELGLMRGNPEEAVVAGAHALFFPHGIGHMVGLDVHDMENLGENRVGYNRDVQRSNQFGLAYLRLARELETGFTITNEPGIYFIPQLIDLWESEKKFTQYINFEKLRNYRSFGGIRIEDNLLITQNGCRLLGKPIPKEIEEVEKLMTTSSI